MTETFMRPKLIISHENQNTITHLQKGLAGCEEITAIKLKPNELLKLEALDAVYLTVMGAERWGALPIPHKAQVLRTAPADAEKGYPPYVIAGSVFTAEDSLDPRFQLRVIVDAVLNAVRSFNLAESDPIWKVGFWAEDLCITLMSPEAAGELIKSVYEEHYPVAS